MIAVKNLPDPIFRYGLFYSSKISLKHSSSIKLKQSLINRETLPIFMLLIIITALVSSAWYFQKQIDNAHEQANNLQIQLNELQNPIYNLTIENVSTDSWGIFVGLTLGKTFNITIRNNGDRDVGGLTTKFNFLDNGNLTNSSDFGVGVAYPQQLGVLHPNESIVIIAVVMTNWDNPRAGKSLVIDLMLDQTVLDEYIISLA
jgi:hypothetical protein